MTLKRVLEGLNLVVIGSLLLANTLGALDWSIWLSVFSLWPLLLVAAGVDLIGKSMDNQWIRASSSLIVTAGLLYGALVMPATGWTGIVPSGAAKTYSQSYPSVPGVSDGDVTIRGGAGRLTVGDGAEMLSATVSTPFGRPDITADVSGTTVNADIGGTEGVGPVFLGTGDTRTEVELGRDIAWEVDINAGAADIDADLSGLEVSRVALAVGASAAKIRLSDRTDAEVNVSGGATSVEVLVPEGVGVEVRIDGIPNSVDVPGDWTQDGQVRRSPGFDQSAPRVTVHLTGGMNSLKVANY